MKTINLKNEKCFIITMLRLIIWRLVWINSDWAHAMYNIESTSCHITSQYFLGYFVVHSTCLHYTNSQFITKGRRGFRYTVDLANLHYDDISLYSIDHVKNIAEQWFKKEKNLQEKLERNLFGIIKKEKWLTLTNPTSKLVW